MTDPAGTTGGSRTWVADLHGLVRVGLRDATPADVRLVRRQLGPIVRPARPDDPPDDLTVRFVDRLQPGRPLTYVGYPGAGHDDDAFYLLRGRQGVAARTRVPFDAVGRAGCEIVTERRVGAVPHLLAMVNLRALATGVLPLHASAFLLDGQGVLATGWSKGGKTETLLAFAALGARYVGDEWIYLGPDGEMVGVPEPIRLWHWHLRQLPHVWRRLPRSTRVVLGGLDRSADAAEVAGQRLAGRAPAVASALRRGAPVLRRQAYRQVPPADLFGPGGTVERARMDAVLLVRSHDDPAVTAEPVEGAVVADVMRASLTEERSAFLADYRQFRFAFPDRSSDVVERAEEIEAKLLTRLFAGRPAYRIGHPYPMRLADLVPPVRTALSRLASDRGQEQDITGGTP